MRRRDCLVALASLSLVACGAAADRPAGTIAAEVGQKATAEGSVRLLVQLRVPRDADAGAIAAAKRALLAELAGTRHRVARELEGLPALALEVSPEALQRLGASAHVERVVEDQPRRPQR